MNELMLTAPIGFLLLALWLRIAWRFGEQKCAVAWGAAWTSLWIGAALLRLDTQPGLPDASGAGLTALAPWLFLVGVCHWKGVAPPRWWPLAAILGMTVRTSVLLVHGPLPALWAGALVEVPVLLVCTDLARRAWQRERPAGGPLLLAVGFAAFTLLWAANPAIQGQLGRLSIATFALWNSVSFSFIWLQIGATVDRARLRAERELRASEEALQRAQALARLGSWQLDAETGLAEWSDEAYRILGYEPGSVQPSLEAFSKRVHPDDRERVKAGVRAAIEKGEPYDARYRVLTPDGELRSLRSLSERQRDPATGKLFLLGAALDETERVRADQELASYREHLEELVEARTAELQSSREELQRSERLASIGTLAAGVAHQLNNPLASILAAAQYARRCEGEEDWPEVARRALVEAEREARRGGDVIRSLLHFAGDRSRERTPEPLARIVRRACASTEGYAARQGARLEIDPHCDESLVAVNGIEIEQVVVNLLRNAIESREMGTHVLVRVRREAHDCIVDVQDDGEGIPEEDLGRVFDPFFTTRTEEEGTGLGLAFAQRIVGDYGGRIDLRSTRRRGTTVTVRLPILGERQEEASPGPGRARLDVEEASG